MTGIRWHDLAITGVVEAFVSNACPICIKHPVNSLGARRGEHRYTRAEMKPIRNG
jgi:hypothetical protein